MLHGHYLNLSKSSLTSSGRGTVCDVCTLVEFGRSTPNISGAVPVIAVFTKFDDLVAQLYDRDREEESRINAFKAVKERFETPLENSRDRPKAYVCFEGAFIYMNYQVWPSELLF